MDALTPTHSPEQQPNIESHKPMKKLIDLPINKIQTISEMKMEKMDTILSAYVSRER